MGLTMMETAATAAPTDSVWLETPLLRFVDVADGQSQAQPILVAGFGDEPPVIEVVAPPLAPFSVIDRPGRFVTDRRSVETGYKLAELWIRYDATSPMALDRGRVTIWHPQSGTRWTIELHGSGMLADRTGA